MNPFSAPVLLTAAALASPALWDAFVRNTLPVDVALTRYLVTAGICWLVLSVVVDLVGAGRRRTAELSATTIEPSAEPQEDSTA